MENYIIMDIQDVTDYWEGTLEDIKTFILDVWGSESFETDEEEKQFDEAVQSADIDLLRNMLNGIGYLAFDSEEERIEWIEEAGL
jgi:hypothetical protein